MAVKLVLENGAINGMLEYWQRGQSFSAVANNAYTADMWQYFKTGTMVHEIIKSSNVPSDAYATSSMNLGVTTAQAVLGAGDYALIEQKMEGVRLRKFKGKKFAIGVWVYSNKTGVFCITLRNANLDRYLVTECTITQSNVWQFHVVRNTHDASGLWSYDSAVGLRMAIVLAAGSSFRSATSGVWASGLQLATANQANFVDALNDFNFTEFCIIQDSEDGSRTPSFQLAGTSLAEELLLCKRHYQKSYDLNVAPGTATGRPVDYQPTATDYRRRLQFPVRMRVPPTVVIYNGITGAANNLRVEGTNYAATVSGSSEEGIQVRSTGATVVGDPSWEWTADASL